MSLRKTVVRQRDFSGGEIDESAQRRDDTKIFAAALKRGLNLQPLDTGACRRRAGRQVHYFDGGLHDIVRPAATAEFDITFAALRFTARLTGGAVVANIVAPWTEAMLPLLSWQEIGRRIFVAHRDMPPQVLEYDDETGTWSLFAFSFRTVLNGALSQPFYRFADFGETMQPSAVTGSITLTTSSDVFEAGHIGTRFTWVGKQVQITAVADARHATATVIETLPPSYRVTVSSVAGYVVGETVEGDKSSCRAELVAIGATTIDVVIIEGYAGFTVTETVVGRDGRGVVSGQAGIGPLASVQWEEAFISSVRGYPGSVSSDVQRVIFCDFPQAEQGILWSAIGSIDDFLPSGEADGAIFEFITARCRVLYVIGGADEFVITDRGVFYVPISGSSPLAPGSVEFRLISSDGAAQVRPVSTPDGLMFVGRTRTRLYAIIGTGQVARSYITRSLTDFHSHLFTEVISIAAGDESNDALGGRYFYAVNADGTAVAGRYSETSEWTGWFSWESTGMITAVCARYGEVLFAVAYDLPGGLVETVEGISASAVMDGTINLADFVGSDPLQDSTGDPIKDSTGKSILAVAGALVPFASATVDAMADGFYLGTIDIDVDGSIVIDGTDLTSVSIGFKFPVLIIPLLPSPDGGEAVGQRMRRRKVSKVMLTVRDTQVFEADGHTFAGFDAGEGMETSRPVRDKTYRYRKSGRSFDPEISITQTVPGSFMLIESTVELTV